MDTPLSTISSGDAPASEQDAPRTLIERTYARLRDDIIERRIAPGAKLRVEHLRQHYEVGSGTLREALTHLVSDALVEAEGQRGFRVAPMNMEDLEDVTNLRVQIEIQALRESIRQADAQWRADVSEVYQAMSEIEQPILPANAQRWEVLNMRFHEVLVSGCGSPWTLRLLQILSRHSERYRRYSISLNQGGARDVHGEHRAIYEAAMSGNDLRAALVLEAHVRATPELIKAAQANGIDVFGEAPADARDTPVAA